MKKGTKFLAIVLALCCLLSFATVLVSAAVGSEAGRALTPAAGDVMNTALVMKVGSDSALKNSVTMTLFTDGKGNACGGPYKDENGTVMVPITPILVYANLGHSATSDSITVTSSGITLTVGSTSTSGKVISLATAPVKKTFGSTTVIYVALDDVEAIVSGYYVTYDASGMIFISLYDEFVNRTNDADESLIKDIAKKFIFSEMDFRQLKNASGQSIIGDYRSNKIGDKSAFANSFYQLSEIQKLYSMFEEGTNNFTHPYIMTSQAKFDELNANYTATENYDEELRWYIETQIAYADTYLNKYANFNEDGSYAGLKDGHWAYDSEGKANTGTGWNTSTVDGITNHSVSIMPYQGPQYDRNLSTGKGFGQGYDPAGGRLNVLSDGETALVGALEPAALAYQITRDEKYLAFAYDWMVALCSWEHWGPGHFLNVTNTARPLATAYDWLYNDFVRVYKQDAVDDLAERIYENAVYEAMVSLTGNDAEHYRYGDSSRYWIHTGNWNSCGTSGMLIASLAVLGNEGWGEEYKEECLYVIAASLGHYMERGFTYITLDGGYRESAGYWGAVRFMHTIHKVLQDTAGTDFGLMDYPGMDTADYFGSMLEGPSYKRWNYHDDWEGTQSNNWFYLSADLYNNAEYAAIRYEQLHSGNRNKTPHRYDVLYYDKNTIDNLAEVNLPLDYSMTSIDATVVRDSWEKNSLFAGLMGGYNNVAHGQYDSGNWIYENKGIRWFVDLGADNYNLYGGGLSMGYYKYSAEGNNTIAMGSLPHGQVMDSSMNADTMGGQLISFKNNEYGSATIIDQKTVYNGTADDALAEKVKYAYRGMLFTNDRKTFVIQDEIKTNSAEDLYWFAHYNNNTILKIEFSDDARTVYMWAPNPDGNFAKIRVSLVSDNKNLKFEIMDTYTYVLSGTPAIDYSPSHKAGIKEDDRSQFSKLVVKAEDVTELNMAVVIEVVNGSDKPDLGYGSITPMSDWEIVRGNQSTEGEETPVYTVHYGDGHSENYYTSRLAEGLLIDPNDLEKANSSALNTKDGITSIDCFDNVTVDTNLNMNFKEHWTINLNGNVLYQTKSIRDGVSTTTPGTGGGITINNGMIYATSHFQLRIGTTLTLNNVDYFTKGFSIRDEGARIIINNSKVTTNTYLIHMVNVDNMSASSGHDLIISNSEVSVGTNLIVFAEGNKTNQNYHNIYFINNSKFAMPEYVYDAETNPLTEAEFFASSLVRYAKDNSGNESTKSIINFILGEGVMINYSDFTLPADEVTDDVQRTYSLVYRTGMSLSEGGDLDIGILTYADGVFGYESYMCVMGESGDTEYPGIVVRSNSTPYYEAHYKNGSVLYYYTNDVVTSLPTNNVDNNVTKIVLLVNSILTKEAKLGNSQKLVLDLNGKTLNISGRITMGSSVSSAISCSVTVKNGTLNKTGGDGFCARMGTTLIFKDLTITSTTKLLWDNGASNIIFDSCTVNATGNLVYARVFFKENIDIPRNLYVIDTNMDISGSLFFYSECTAEKDERDFVLMGNSRISYANVLTYDSNLPANIGFSDYRFHIEKGALVSKDGFGLPESTETEKYSAFGYEYIELDEDYEISESRRYPVTSFVAQGGYYTVDFTTAVVGVKGSLTLYSDFTINFFLPVENNAVEKVTANGVEYLINEDTEIFVDANGVSYYKIMVRNVAPHIAADDIEIVFHWGSHSEVKTFSVIEYCKLLLANSSHSSSHALAASVVDYVSAAYEYTSSEKPAVLTNLLASSDYLNNLPEPMPADSTTTSKNTAGVAIQSAQLDLSGSLNFRLNLMPDFNGTLYINGAAYEVVNGKCDGLSYINYGMRAFDMYNPEKKVTIYGDGFSGTYDLRAYIANSDKGDLELQRLLSSLYTYCTESYAYKYGIVVVRPDLGNTPSVDVDFFG